MFNHLHVHTDGSTFDGATQIDRAIAKAIELGSNALGITDHGNMIKAFEFQEKCLKANIKPIIGCEFYIGEEDSQDTFHLICIAKDNTGLKNLYKLNTYAYTKNFYKKPRITMEQLEIHKHGLIITTACLGSQTGQWFIEGNIHGRIELRLQYLKSIFGDDFYLEIQPNSIPEQVRYNKKLCELSHELRIPLVATCDVHYVNREDFESHDTMLCMQTEKKKDDTSRWRFSCNDFYMKDEEQIRTELWNHGLPAIKISESFRNTVEIANKCNARIESGLNLLPHLPGVDDEDLRLAELCNIGFQKRYREGAFEGLDINTVVERIKYELSVIKQKGYSGYFLIVDDYIKYARDNDIPVGPGRGSVCGCEVAFLLGIHSVEPIKYGLLFERFLNPDRNSPPDKQHCPLT